MPLLLHLGRLMHMGYNSNGKSIYKFKVKISDWKSTEFVWLRNPRNSNCDDQPSTNRKEYWLSHIQTLLQETCTLTFQISGAQIWLILYSSHKVIQDIFIWENFIEVSSSRLNFDTLSLKVIIETVIIYRISSGMTWIKK